MLKFLFKLVEMNISPKVFVLLRRKVPMSQNMHVYKAAPLTLRGFTCNKMIKRLTTLFKHVGRFPFNPKFRKKSQLTFTFSAAVDQLSGLLRKQRFTSAGSKGYG